MEGRGGMEGGREGGAWNWCIIGEKPGNQLVTDKTYKSKFRPDSNDTFEKYAI